MPAARVRMNVTESRLQPLLEDPKDCRFRVVSASDRSPGLRRGGGRAAERAQDGRSVQHQRPARHEEEARWPAARPRCTRPTWRLRAQREAPSESLVFEDSIFSFRPVQSAARS